MRPPPRSSLILVLAVVFGCEGETTPHLSYDRCQPGDLCGLGTTCLTAPWSVVVPAATVCTAPCAVDRDCPGLTARCTLGTTPLPDGGTAPVSRCLRHCLDDDDCRPGTRCRILSPVSSEGEPQRLCVPDNGPRACTTDDDCAPFVGRCNDGVCLWQT